MAESQPVAPATRPAATNVAKPWNMTPANMGEALKYAEMIAHSDLVPDAYKGKPGNVVIAVQMGQEVGLSPLQAVQNIAVINGHPSIWGDALPALAKRHPDFVYENTQWDAESMVATCRIQRKGEPETVRQFSWSDAERAGLHTKDTYKKYPQRMCSIRARAWAIRDVFPDALKGLYVAEEALDIPPTDYHVVPTDADLETETPTHGVDGLAAHMNTQAETVIESDGVQVDTETGEIVVDIDGLKARMDNAQDMSELEKIGLEFNALENGDAKTELRKHYRTALNRLVTAMAEGSETDAGDNAGETAGDTQDA